MNAIAWRNEGTMNNKHLGSEDSGLEPTNSEGSGGFSKDSQDAIGKQLRRMYGRLVSEPLPDRFTKLLQELGKSEKPEPKS